MKKFLFLLLGIGVVVLGFVAFNAYVYRAKQGTPLPQTYKDATYVIDGKVIALADGFSEEPAAPGSVSKIVTRYFGNEAHLDLNGDGREDVVFLLTQETGGSGTFFYVVAALNTPDGFVGSQGFFLGDRIAPQTTEARENGVVVVNYADRAPEESFAASPSIGQSVWLRLDSETMQLINAS